MTKNKDDQDVMDIIYNAITESIGELTTEQRTKARLAGQTTFHVRITLSELEKLVAERLKGLRGVEFAPDDLPDELSTLDDEEELIDVVMPSSDDLRNHWLPVIAVQAGYSFTSDGTIEFDTEVPPPRNMHAR